MDNYVCIHGHFYQPPRENPWLEAIELQFSAYPFHDWNERITAECYEPNSASRILDDKSRIIDIVNNYEKISFNFGPTLLAWMQQASPEVYQAILNADIKSQSTFSGHGSALAQAYNHLIMPLANRRDKYTQVRWGIRDFESRFHRSPEGMWLPETAVDLETLDIMAELGLKFTVLAPHQAARIRRIEDGNWTELNGQGIDPSMAYELRLASGRKINLFFYDGPVAQAVAYEGLLDNGEQFASRLIGTLSGSRKWPQLIHVATDGESYGHHHRYGDMALAYALKKIKENPRIHITNYSQYLAEHPPTHEVQIIENTSWSCVHGVERWRKNCGCNTGGHPGWNQEWRAPLRQSIDWLRDAVAPAFEEKAGKLLKNPWAARDAYIDIILDRSPKSIRQFLVEYATRRLDRTERIEVLKLLELQRHAMLMYTSCGWFFDELSGLETVQVLQYAGRVVQLAEELFGDSTENKFLELMEAAKSNLPEHGDGRRVYEKFVRPAMIDLTKVAAHYAVSSVFEDYSDKPTRIFCYDINVHDFNKENCGRQKVAAGRVQVSSKITHESMMLSFGSVHFGDHNLNAGVRAYRDQESYEEMLNELTRACLSADFPGVIRLLDKNFRTSTYSLKSLFRDEQRKVLDSILASTMTEVEDDLARIYQTNYPLMRFLTNLDNPLPSALKSAAEVVLNRDLRQTLTAETLDKSAVGKILEDSHSWNISLDTEGMGHVFGQALEKKMTDLAANPDDTTLLGQMVESIDLAKSLSFEVELRGVENVYFRMLKSKYPDFTAKAAGGDEQAKDWVKRFNLLGNKLAIYTG